MAEYLTADKLLLAKVESTPGTDASPTPGTNAVKAANLQFTNDFDTDPADDEHTSTLDPGDPIVLGGGVGMTFDVRGKGSGAAGTAPEWGALLRGCAMAETVSASAASDTAQAGGSNTITLAAGESSTDDFYVGMPIDLTGGTGSGQSALITGYVGSTKVATIHKDWATEPDATTGYTIPANVRYAPASLDLETLTLYGYQNSNASAANSRLRRLTGGVGTWSLTVPARGIPRFSFNFIGQLPGLPTDVSRPTGIVFDGVSAAPFRNANLADLGGANVRFNSLSLDSGNQTARDDDPSQLYGFDVGAVTARRITGSINPKHRLLSVRDVMADFLASTSRGLAMRWGDTVGNKLSILVPAARYTGNTPSDANGFAHEDVPFAATGPDAGVFICAH